MNDVYFNKLKRILCDDVTYEDKLFAIEEVLKAQEACDSNWRKAISSQAGKEKLPAILKEYRRLTTNYKKTL